MDNDVPLPLLGCHSEVVLSVVLPFCWDTYLSDASILGANTRRCLATQTFVPIFSKIYVNLHSKSVSSVVHLDAGFLHLLHKYVIKCFNFQVISIIACECHKYLFNLYARIHL